MHVRTCLCLQLQPAAAIMLAAVCRGGQENGMRDGVISTSGLWQPIPTCLTVKVDAGDVMRHWSLTGWARLYTCGAVYQ